jgi:hypothetical protein
LRADAPRWASRGGITTGAAMSGVWLYLLSVLGVPVDQVFVLPLYLPVIPLEILLAVAAGRCFGRLLCYAKLPGLIARANLRLRPAPAHPDRCGGFGRIGRMYLSGALIFGVVVAFLDAWLLLVQVVPVYRIWQGPYAVLLVASWTCGTAALFAPILRFRRLLTIAAEGRGNDPCASVWVVPARVLGGIALGAPVLLAPLLTIGG